LGRPRGFTVSSDGASVAFLRSRASTDRLSCLWVYDVATRAERLVADPLALTRDETDLPAAERRRRVRAREQASGIVSYSVDDSFRLATFALSAQLFVADLASGSVRHIDASGPVFDPRIDPTGRRIAYVSGGTLRYVDLAGGDVELAAEADIAWGVAEFAAAEEMGRGRGFWWAPDGESLLACRVDESAVPRVHIADPANPEHVPATVAYPFAGTANAAVSLWHLAVDGTRREIAWEYEAFPYLVTLKWRRGHAPLLLVASRDQRTMRILDIDVRNGATALVRQDEDPHWLDVVGGVPDRLPDGRLVSTIDDADTRRLVIGREPVTPPGLQVRQVLAVTPEAVLFSASTEPTEQHVWCWSESGLRQLTNEPGVHTATTAADIVVTTSVTTTDDAARTSVSRLGTDGPLASIESFAAPAPFAPNVSISRQGHRELRTALVLPENHVPGVRLPVLMDPYGGPHSQRVTASRFAYQNAQWLANQGFAVVIVDGRGTPGRGAAWERAIAGDLATPVLDDQIDALQSLAAARTDLDVSKVAIRGWSFGGYLATLAVLRRPDVFHAAVAGAPVTDWRLYDTYYTERYLGIDASAPAYESSSLLRDAAALRRPLLLIHGLADDNVLAAHTLRLSSALLAAGRPHTVLPLPGATHMVSHQDVAAGLLNLEVAFVKDALGVA
jgi:dipeptidyl-peptidase-4